MPLLFEDGPDVLLEDEEKVGDETFFEEEDDEEEEGSDYEEEGSELFFEEEDDEEEEGHPEQNNGFHHTRNLSPFQQYMKEMGEIPILPHNEQKSLAELHEKARQRFVFAILQSPFIIRRVFSILREIYEGNKVFNRNIRISGTEPAVIAEESPVDQPLTEDAIRGRLPHNLETLEELIRQDDLILEQLQYEGPSERKKNLRIEREILLAKCARLEMESPLITKELVKLLKALQKCSPKEAYEEHEESLSDRIQTIKKTDMERLGMRNEITTTNLRLVVSIAKKYRNRGMAFLDLIQYGNTGMIHGVEKYEWRLGNNVSTYITWWIREQITRAIANRVRTIRIPEHVYRLIPKLSKACEQFKERHGKKLDPTDPADIEELSKIMDIPKVNVRHALEDARRKQKHYEFQDDEGDLVPLSFQEDKKTASANENAEANDFRAASYELLKCLTIRERLVFKLRSGLELEKKDQEVVRNLITRRNERPFNKREQALLKKKFFYTEKQIKEMRRKRGLSQSSRKKIERGCTTEEEVYLERIKRPLNAEEKIKMAKPYFRSVNEVLAMRYKKEGCPFTENELALFRKHELHNVSPSEYEPIPQVPQIEDRAEEYLGTVTDADGRRPIPVDIYNGVNPNMTLGAVGGIFGVTRERSRQIEEKAIEKLGTDRNREIMEDFI